MQEAPVLRPLGVADMIDRTIRLIRANFVLLVAIAALPQLVIEVMQRASGLSRTVDVNSWLQLFDPRAVGAAPPRLVTVNGPVGIAVLIASAVLTFAVYGATTVAMADRYLGRAVTIGEAFGRGLRALPATIIAYVVVFLGLAVVFVALVFIATAFNSAASTAIAVILGFIAVCVVVPWTFLSVAVLVPVILLERLGPIAAIRRSLHLMDKARLRTLGLYILLFIIAIVIGVIFGLVFFVSFVTDPTARTVLQTIASVASTAITVPLTYGVFVLLYYDLRVRKEAFDLQLAAEALPREA